MDDIKIARILCAVDFSEYSDYAMRYALALARFFDAELDLLHVVELPYTPTYVQAGLPELNVPTDPIQEAARQRMQQLLEDCRREHSRVKGEVRIGVAFVEIIQRARDAGADLIVVGTHGRTGLRQMIIGSVAEKVVRKASCPVLSVKHPDITFQMP